jgi:tetratricopeptide (TPR) repeat protein
MPPPIAPSTYFDVFLCYNSEDKPMIRAIAAQLRQQGISYWLDEEQLIPGRPWMEILEQDAERVATVAVFVGEQGIGPWQRQEISAFLNRFVRRGLPVIPVLLKNAPQEPNLPLFLENLGWVDFRKSDPDPMSQLLWGITSDRPPSSFPKTSETPHNLTLQGAIAFVGRKQALEDVHALLQQNAPVAICAVAGMGGIGKTELALQYAYQRRANYPGGVCWLKAREDLAAQVIVFARSHLDLNPPTDLEFADQLRWCWQHWGDGQTLLVLDDVQNFADVQKLEIPGRSQFRVLLTTRSHFGRSVRELSLKVLSEAAALELLRSLVDDGRIDQDEAGAKALCGWLGYLPLGVELVGRYLAFDLDLSVAELWAELQQNRLAAEALLAAEPGMTSELGVVAAFELSWQKLTAEAQTVAAFLSLFALSGFSWSWVEAGLPEMDSALMRRIRTRELLGLHLVQRSGEGLYQLHQLLREFFAVKRSQLEGTEQWRSRFLEVIGTAAQQSSESPKKSLIEETTQVIPHLQMAIAYSEAADGALETASGLAWLAELYRFQGRYSEAEPLLVRSLSIREQRLGADHPDVAQSFNNLAALYESQGRYTKAEPLLVRSLSIVEQQLGANHPDVATSLNNLALLYRSQGRYSEAEPLFVRSLSIYEQQLGADHSDVATSLNNLALLYKSQGRYSEAEPLFVRSFSIREKQLGADHPNVAQSLNNLANLYESQGRNSEAERLYGRSLSIYEEQLGADHPDVATSLNNLAELYRSQGRYSEAEPLRLRCLEIERRTLGEDHPQLAASLNNLAALYYAQRRYSEAEPLLGRSLSILEKVLPANHPTLAIVRENLELLRQQMQQP